MPVNGHLTAGKEGKVKIQAFSNRRMDNTFAPIIDTGIMLLGAGAGVAAIIGTGGMAAPLTMGLTSSYAAGRGISTLADMNAHHQSLHWKNPQARGAYLDIAGGALGMAALGTAAMAGFTMGSTSAKLTSLAAVLGPASDAVDVLELVNGAHSLIAYWSDMTLLQRAQALASMMFWSAMFSRE